MKIVPRPPLVAAVLAGVALSVAAPAFNDARAANVPGYPDDLLAMDAREIAMLPRYCIYTQEFRSRVPGGNNQAEIERWTGIMGPTFGAMHHHCLGLMKTNRAVLLARSQQWKKFYLEDAIREFNYVIERAPPDFVMLPELFTKKGENLLRLGSGPLGVTELERAIALKPDYWPPYAALGDYYKEQGDLARAREILEKAAAVAPDAQAIKRRLSEVENARTTKGKSKSAERK